MSGGRTTSRAGSWALLAATAGALFLRVWACRGELWLDEIMSFEDARGAASALDLLQHITQRNSHFLTALWMYLVGDTSHFWLYRLPPLIAGCLLVPVAAWPLRRRAGDVGAIGATLLFGGSLFLVTYSSEARAYAGLMLHALLAFRLIEATEERSSTALDWAVAVILLTGALWLSAFLLVWVAVTLWAPISGRPKGSLLRMLALPWAGLGVLALFGVFAQIAALGPERPRLVVLRRFLEECFVPAGPWLLRALLGAAAAAVVVLSFLRPPDFESKSLRRLRLLLCTVPIAGVLASPSTSIFERYFSPALPFLYLSALYGLLSLLALRNVAARWASGTVLACVLGSNLVATGAFLRDGRGHYLEALRWMAERSPHDAPIRYFTDHPYRNGTLVGFYARYVPGVTFEQILYTALGNDPSQWAIVHQIDDDEYAVAAPGLYDERYRYRWVRSFAKSGLSGFRWHLYELDRENSPALRHR